MIEKSVCIVNSKKLFLALSEIKDQLNLNIIDINIKSLDKKLFNYDNYIFIFTNKNHIYSKELENKSLVLDSFPLSIFKLLEEINTLFLKLNYQNQSNIVIKNYKLNLNSRTISSNLGSLKLTEKEMNLIVYLNRIKKPQKINELQKIIWYFNDNLETHTVETHIYRLRKKIKIFFDDENFLLSNSEGYYL